MSSLFCGYVQNNLQVRESLLDPSPPWYYTRNCSGCQALFAGKRKFKIIMEDPARGRKVKDNFAQFEQINLDIDPVRGPPEILCVIL